MQNVAFDVEAYGGYFAWSIPAPQPRRLVLVSPGGNRRLVPARPIFNFNPFGLGADRRGRAVAVYPRCKTSRLGCNLYQLDLKARHERALVRLSKPRRSENEVAVSRGRYLFVRVNRFAVRPAGRVPHLFITRPLREVSDIPVSLRGWRRPAAAAISQLALRRNVAAVTTNTRLLVVYLTRSGPDRWCPIARAAGARSVVITARYVYWVKPFGEFNEFSRVLRRRLPSAGCIQRGPSELLRTASGLSSVAVSGGRVFYTRESLVAGSYTLFEMTDPAVPG
jgi:hypothetical protein